MKIDLNDKIPSCEHFKWKEALRLNKWDIFVYPERPIAVNIMETARVMDKIRKIMGEPIYISSWYRPFKYNRYVDGATRSAHMEGLAVDFYLKRTPIHEAREKLRYFLESLDIRMEKHNGGWIHIDLREPGATGRYFIP